MITSPTRLSFARVLIFASVFIVPEAVYSQTNPCSRRVVSANVFMRDWRPVEGLQGTDFRASVQGSPVEIMQATGGHAPRRIVLVLDASGSMTGNKRDLWNLYLAAADHLLTNLRQGTSVGLEVFASRIEKTVPLNTNRAALRTEIRQLDSIEQIVPSKQRETALWDALQHATQDFSPLEEGDVIYAFTDGGNNHGHTTLHEVSRQLQSRGIRLFWFYLPEEELRRKHEVPGGPAEFEELVTDSGGLPVKVLLPEVNRKHPFIDENGAETKAGLRLQAQYQLMMNFYRIEITSSALLGNATGWRVRLTTPNLHDVQVLYPRSLPDCSNSATDSREVHR